MATGLQSWSQTSASNATADASINWQEGQAPSSVNDSARAMMAVVAKWRDDNNGSLTTGGGTTVYTLTTNTVFVALAAGIQVAFSMNATNTGTSTLNVDGLGAKPLRTAAGVEIGAGALVIGGVYRATYFTSNSGEWIILGQAALGDATVTTAKLATNAVTTVKVTDSNITYAKIQNVSATARLLGRATAAAGIVEEVTLGAGLAMVAGALTPTISPPLVPNYLSGLTLSTAGSSATMSIAAGVASDSTNVTLMSLTAIAKTTASWVVGTGNGGIDTGAVANSTWYHFFVITRVDTGVVDVLFSLSATAPTMPTNYTLKRRIGSGLTDGSGKWTAFTQVGDKFTLSSMSVDSPGSVGTSAVIFTLKVPTGVVVKAMFRAGTVSSGNCAALFTSLSETDVAVNANTGPCDFSYSGGNGCAASLERLTDTSAQIRVRANSVGVVIWLYTYGWEDVRGK